MIVNVCGASGAGKSHLVRALMALGRVREVRVSGRTSPLGYELGLPGEVRSTYVVGSYEAPTGGADTIKDTRSVFPLVLQWHEAGLHVLYEGLYVMSGTLGPELARDAGPGQLVVLRLTTSVEECEDSIFARRRARAERAGRPMTERELRPPVETRANHLRAQRYAAKMREAGARVLEVSREDALPALLEVLR